jgi:protein phosphatase PTC7
MPPLTAVAFPTRSERIMPPLPRRALFLPSFLLLSSVVTAFQPDVPPPPSDEAVTMSTTPDESLRGGVGAYFAHKSVIIPHDDKRHRGGEDAAAACDTMLVVADGVGGWASRGVDPGLYSKLLVKTIVELHEKGAKKSLVELVETANEMAAANHLGTATCTVLQLTAPDTVRTLNIGDSGYGIYRVTTDDKVENLFVSPVGQKRFNFPHQIGGHHGDRVANVAKEESHTVQPGDVIVAYSDGVSDNLDPAEDFDACLLDYLEESYSLAADCIARRAYELGKDESFDSPFAAGARRAGWRNYRGGKHDDITVTVARVFKGGEAVPVKDDPHYQESIYLYAEQPKPLADLPRRSGARTEL